MGIDRSIMAARASGLVLLVLLTAGCGPSASERAATLKAQTEAAEAQRAAARATEERQIAEAARKLVVEEQERQEQARVKRQAEEQTPERVALRADIQVARGLVASSCGGSTNAQANDLLDQMEGDQDAMRTQLRSAGLVLDKNNMIVGRTDRPPTASEISKIELEETNRKIKRAKDRYARTDQQITECATAKKQLVTLESKLPP